MYSKRQDEFAKCVAVFLVLLLASCAVLFGVFLGTAYLAPTFLAAIPESALRVGLALWPAASLLGALGLRRHKFTERCLWSQEK